MKVDAGIGHQLERIPDAVRAAEAAGYDGVRTAEMNHDPFFPLDAGGTVQLPPPAA